MSPSLASGCYTLVKKGGHVYWARFRGVKKRMPCESPGIGRPQCLASIQGYRTRAWQLAAQGNAELVPYRRIAVHAGVNSVRHYAKGPGTITPCRNIVQEATLLVQVHS